MEKTVPRWAWHAYMDACDALAEAFSKASPGALSTSERHALSKGSGNSGDDDPAGRNVDLSPTSRIPRRAQRFTVAAFGA
jgi:hypothetical protein